MVADVFRGTGNGSCGLYLHVPFCSSKCPYCAFYSRPLDKNMVEAYVRGIEREVDLLRRRFSGRLATLYIGGGTPSVLSVGDWARILVALERFDRLGDVEFTVEANPESLTVELLTMWRTAGVNRVSLGIQSLNDDLLKTLGRRHDGQRARQAVKMVLKSYARLSCDLMFGLPGGNLRCFAQSVDELVDLGVRHLSIYQLTIEPESFWGRRPPAGMDDGYGSYRWAQWHLPRRGLHQYEIASFATLGQESRHNGLYWMRANVLPLGPSAWGFWEGLRIRNEPTVERWLSALDVGRLPRYGWERLRGPRAASEALILATRTTQGLDLEDWTRRFGPEARGSLERRLDKLPVDCLRRSSGRLALTARGMRLGNAIWSELLDL